MEDLSIYQDASLKIQEQFETGIELPQGLEQQEYLQQLRKILAERIAYMLEHERDHLKWVLYRIDVNEQKVLQKLAEQPLHEAVESIADLIIERQVQKAITRRQYPQGNGEMNFDI